MAARVLESPAKSGKGRRLVVGNQSMTRSVVKVKIMRAGK